MRSFTLDANGSTTADGQNTFAYDTRGRMISATSSLGTTTYHVNALGQRVRKTNSLGDRVFTYDVKGHLIAESTAAGAVLKEYIWLGDLPLAVFDSSGSYFIHADHLNTPRLVADATGTTVWKWDQQEPFGSNVADENPSGLGTFDLPLRLPGQYFDRENNLAYNWHRHYDAGIGRYAQSDPIGLLGGVNTYGYVGSAPLLFIDPWGLARKCAGKGASDFNPDAFPECRATFVASDAESDTDVKEKELDRKFHGYIYRDPRVTVGPDLNALSPQGFGRAPPSKPEITVAWYKLFQRLMEEVTTTTTRRWVAYHLSCERVGKCGKVTPYDLDLTYCGPAITSTSTSRGWKPHEEYVGRYAIDWYIP